MPPDWLPLFLIKYLWHRDLRRRPDRAILGQEAEPRTKVAMMRESPWSMDGNLPGCSQEPN